MSKPTKDLLYLLTILESLEKIELYTHGISSGEEFYKCKDQLIFNACLNLLMAIGEESKKISDDLKSTASFDWRPVISLRNKLAHDYRGIDFLIIWDILKQHLPALKKVSIQLVVTCYNRGGFELKLLREMIHQEHFRHLEFLVDHIEDNC